jgi:hypothetical protein
MTSHSYHNKTQLLTQKQLIEYENIAQTQDQKILNCFVEYPIYGITCDDIERVYPDILLTSIRRSLTNLAHAGKIVKVGQREGQYKRPVNIYSFVKL